MDTDFLSEEACNIIRVAAGFDDTLKAILGASCSDCTGEEEYLKHISDLITEIKKDTRDYLEEWGLDDSFSVRKYREKLATVEAEIQKVLKIPAKNRKYEKW
jgi:hypothetical protein